MAQARTLTFQQALDVPPRMILEMASGTRLPEEIAMDYGFSEEQYDALKKHEPFTVALKAKQAELKASGWVFKAKCAFIAEELLDEMYRRAAGSESSFSALLETVKFTSKAAGIDAPVKEQVNAGSQFSITINLGGGKSVQVGVSQNENIVDAEEVAIDAASLNFDFETSFSEVPAHLQSGNVLEYVEE